MKWRCWPVILFVCLSLGGLVTADEIVPFPFWQHGFGVTTFFSVVNAGPTTGRVTIHLMAPDGTLIQATLPSDIAPNNAWLPDTGSWGGWYIQGNRLGWGYFEIESDHDQFYLWSCVYGLLPWGQTGFTIVLPQNPYGNP